MKLKKVNTDFLMTVVIVDPTNPDDGLPINIFAEDETKLPQVTYVGDIFRAHRLKVSASTCDRVLIITVGQSFQRSSSRCRWQS